MTRQVCGVYYRAEATYIVSSAWTESGLLIDHEPVIKLDPDTPIPIMGEAVLTALAATQKGIPAPQDQRAITAPLLQAVGFKTWRAFTKDALYLGVNYDGTKVEIIPSVASRGGFDYRGDKAATCPPAPNDVGALLIKQRALCS
jgi:hypothetical protein